MSADAMRDEGRRENDTRPALAFEQVAEASVDGIVVLDCAWRYLYLNPQAERLLGRSRRDLVGKVIWEAFPDSARGPFSEAYRRCMDERVPVALEGFSQSLGGWFDLRCVPAQEGIIISFRDITDRKQAEEERRDLMTHARCLLWSGTVIEFDDGGLWWDTDVPDEAAAQAFFPLDLVPGERYTDAWYRHRLPEDQKLTDEMSGQALREGRPYYSAEFRCRDQGGRVHWFLEQVSVVPRPLPPSGHERQVRRWRVVGVATDTTERRRAERLLSESEERYRFLSQMSLEGIAVHEKGTILDANHA